MRLVRLGLMTRRSACYWPPTAKMASSFRGIPSVVTTLAPKCQALWLLLRFRFFCVYADKSLSFFGSFSGAKGANGLSVLKRRPLALRDFRYRDIKNIAIFGNESDTVIIEKQYRDISMYRDIEQPMYITVHVMAILLVHVTVYIHVVIIASIHVRV